MAAPRNTVGRETVRKRLGGLSIEEVEDAAVAGLLRRLSNGRFDADSVAAAEVLGEQWHAELHKERRLNATDAAARLGIPVSRFRRAIKAGQIKPVAQMPWKYGTIWFYRGSDIDELAGWFTLDAASRHVESVSKRSAAAKKGAETRRRNGVIQQEARLILEATLPGEDADDAQVVVHVAAMCAIFGYRLPQLDRFMGTFMARFLADAFARARFSAEERAQMRCEWYDRGLEAVSHMSRIRDIEREMGLPAGTLPGPCPHLEGWISKRTAVAWLAANPSAVEKAREAEQGRQAVAEAARVLRQAEREIEVARRRVEIEAFLEVHAPEPGAHPTEVFQFAVAFATGLGVRWGGMPHCNAKTPTLTAAAAAMDEVFSGINDPGWPWLHKTTRQWRELGQAAQAQLVLVPGERRRRCARAKELDVMGVSHCDAFVVPGELAKALKSNPEVAARWAAEDEKDAQDRAEKDRARQAKRAKRKAKLKVRNEAWRAGWAQAFGVPVNQVPPGIGNPTPHAIRQAKQFPQRWMQAQPEPADHRAGQNS